MALLPGPARRGRERRRRPPRPYGADAPLWLNILWIAAFALAVGIGVRVANAGWRMGWLEILFLLVSIGALVGSIVAARPRAG